MGGKTTYEVGLKCYRKFCAQMDWLVFPISRFGLELFVTSLAKKVTYQTIKVYLCSLQHSIILGHPLKIRDMDTLHKILKGIKREGPRGRPLRAPITTSNLLTLFRFVEQRYQRYDALMWKALFSVAFFGLLRCAEYTSPTTTFFDKNVHLRVADVTMSKGGNRILLKIKAGKGDPFREGAFVRLVAISSFLCPVKAVNKYLEAHKFRDGPFFRFQDGRFVTRGHVANVVKTG